MPTIGLNEFVVRQTPDSKFSHFGGTGEELTALTEANFSSALHGYRDGVMRIPVPPNRFFSGVVEATADMTFRTTFEARRKGEAPYLQTVALGGDKLPAKAVEIIIYCRDVLLEEGSSAVSTEAEWEIVSINARPTEGPEPPTPMAIARNMLGLPGGTDGEFTARELAESVVYDVRMTPL